MAVVLWIWGTDWLLVVALHSTMDSGELEPDIELMPDVLEESVLCVEAVEGGRRALASAWSGIGRRMVVGEPAKLEASVKARAGKCPGGSWMGMVARLAGKEGPGAMLVTTDGCCCCEPVTWASWE